MTDAATQTESDQMHVELALITDKSSKVLEFEAMILLKI
jgi:hypothetical protein